MTATARALQPNYERELRRPKLRPDQRSWLIRDPGAFPGMLARVRSMPQWARLTFGERNLLLELLEPILAHGSKAVTQNRLAFDLNASRESVNRWLRSLLALKLLNRWQPRVDRPYRYRLGPALLAVYHSLPQSAELRQHLATPPEDNRCDIKSPPIPEELKATENFEVNQIGDARADRLPADYDGTNGYRDQATSQPPPIGPHGTAPGAGTESERQPSTQQGLLRKLLAFGEGTDRQANRRTFIDVANRAPPDYWPALLLAARFAAFKAMPAPAAYVRQQLVDLLEQWRDPIPQSWQRLRRSEVLREDLRCPLLENFIPGAKQHEQQQREQRGEPKRIDATAWASADRGGDVAARPAPHGGPERPAANVRSRSEGRASSANLRPASDNPPRGAAPGARAGAPDDRVVTRRIDPRFEQQPTGGWTVERITQLLRDESS